MGHSHSHSHDHGVGEQTATGAHRGRLLIVFFIYLLIILAELIGAWWANSLALVAEAMHMTVDSSGILIALIAAWLATRKASPRRTYGWMRAEIIAVLINCFLLLGVGVFIAYEAVDRWINPPQVHGVGVIGFAVVGVIGSAVSLFLLAGGQKESLNVKAAFLEVMSDGIGAAGIILSGVLNVAFGWNRIDAIAAAAVGLIVLPRTFVLLKKAVNIIMQGVPEGMNVKEIRASLAAAKGVDAIHSLHVWALTSGVPVLSAHVRVSEQAWVDGSGPRILDELTHTAQHQWGIDHCTFQLEEPGHEHHEAAMHAN